MAKEKNTDPKVDWKLEALRLASINEELREGLLTAHYTTLDEFLEDYSAALRDFLVAQYGNETRNHHPHDLASSVASFGDAWWAIMDNKDFGRKARSFLNGQS
jgi:hypothetical protein